MQATDPLRAYATIARRYAGDEPGEDDPAMRRACRLLFTERLRGVDVLEVGCGPAIDAHVLSQEGLNVTASDGCAEFLVIVNERFPALSTAVFDFTAPAPFSTRFDGVYGFACLLHLPRALAPTALRHLRGVLRPGGLLFLSLIRSTRVRDYVIEDWGGEPGNSVLFTCYEPDEFSSLLTDAGFSEVERFDVRSQLYEELPRLRERGVTAFQVTCRA